MLVQLNNLTNFQLLRLNHFIHYIFTKLLTNSYQFKCKYENADELLLYRNLPQSAGDTDAVSLVVSESLHFRQLGCLARPWYVPRGQASQVPSAFS